MTKVCVKMWRLTSLVKVQGGMNHAMNSYTDCFEYWLLGEMAMCELVAMVMRELVAMVYV